MAKGLHKGQHKVKKVQWHIYYTTRYMCGQNQIQKFKKALCVLVVLGNSQAPLRIPDTAALNILNLNIDSIQVEVANCKTNIEQETHKVAEGCTNKTTVGIIKQNSNGQDQSNKLLSFLHKQRGRQKVEQ